MSNTTPCVLEGNLSSVLVSTRCRECMCGTRRIGPHIFNLDTRGEGGAAVARLVEATNRQVAGSIPDGVIGIFH
jgi:hypothetical protein